MNSYSISGMKNVDVLSFGKLKVEINSNLYYATFVLMIKTHEVFDDRLLSLLQ